MLPHAEVFLLYMDLRMFGRHFEELYKEAQQKYGIQFVRARLSEAFENPDGSLQIRIEDTLLAKPMKMTLDLLVLMVGIQPVKKPDNMMDMLGLLKDADGFLLQEDQYILPFGTGIPGLYAAGGITGPKTIEEALNEARAVVSEISRFLGDSITFAAKERFVIGL
jgi:heterodisulfide reductase subunit A